MTSPKLWVIVLLMFFTAVELHVRGDVDRTPPSQPLSELQGRRISDLVTDGDKIERHHPQKRHRFLGLELKDAWLEGAVGVLVASGAKLTQRPARRVA